MVTIFDNKDRLNIIISNPNIPCGKCKNNIKKFHTTIISQFLNSNKNNKVTDTMSCDSNSRGKNYLFTWVQN